MAPALVMGHHFIRGTVRRERRGQVAPRDEAVVAPRSGGVRDMSHRDLAFRVVTFSGHGECVRQPTPNFCLHPRSTAADVPSEFLPAVRTTNRYAHILGKQAKRWTARPLQS
jgi:hypothetical protein